MKPRRRFRRELLLKTISERLNRRFAETGDSGKEHVGLRRNGRSPGAETGKDKAVDGPK